MARVAWTADARSHFQRHVTRIGRETSARTAKKWAAKLRAAVAILETFPEIGSPIEDGPVPDLREQLVGPYRVVYRFDGGVCLILAIPRAEQDLWRVITPEDSP